MWNDLVNGLFEFGGAITSFINVRSIRRDKKVLGIHWSTYLFFTSWGIWNLIYYPSLNQYFSFTGGVLIVVGNAIWLSHALYYMNSEKINKCFT